MVFYYWTNLNTVNFSIKSFVGTSNHVTTSVKFLLTKWKNPLLLHHLMWTHMWAMLNSEATGHILAMSSDSQTKFLWTLRRLGEVSNVRLWTYLINKERLAKGGSYPYQTSLSIWNKANLIPSSPDASWMANLFALWELSQSRAKVEE